MEYLPWLTVIKYFCSREKERIIQIFLMPYRVDSE